MNIFYLDENPKKAAQMQCDKHVVKMCLESTQILSTVANVLRPNNTRDIYKTTHKNHPCCKWARKTLQNYLWLQSHAIELFWEYKYRYSKEHKSYRVLQEIGYLGLSLANIGFEEPPQCMPEQYKQEDTIQAYRDYYWHDKRNTISMKWTKREKPDWWLKRESNEQNKSVVN